MQSSKMVTCGHLGPGACCAVGGGGSISLGASCSQGWPDQAFAPDSHCDPHPAWPGEPEELVGPNTWTGATLREVPHTLAFPHTFAGQQEWPRPRPLRPAEPCTSLLSSSAAAKAARDLTRPPAQRQGRPRTLAGCPEPSHSCTFSLFRGLPPRPHPRFFLSRAAGSGAGFSRPRPGLHHDRCRAGRAPGEGSPEPRRAGSRGHTGLSLSWEPGAGAVSLAGLGPRDPGAPLSDTPSPARTSTPAPAPGASSMERSSPESVPSPQLGTKALSFPTAHLPLSSLASAQLLSTLRLGTGPGSPLEAGLQPTLGGPGGPGRGRLG